MSVTKKYRCRYFEEDGRPIPPTCNQGDACRFVHPSDPNWPGRTPFVDTRVNRSSAIKRHKDSDRTIAPHAAEGRGLALVPQSDLFLRRKPEGDDQSVRIDRAKPRQKEWDTRVNRDHDNYRERDRHRTNNNYAASNDRVCPRRSISPARPYAKKYNRTESDISKKSEHDGNKGPTKHHGDLTSNEHKRNPDTSVISKIEESVDPKDDFASSSARNSTWGRPGSLLRAPKTHANLVTEIAVPERHSDETKQTERLVGLFRSLARLSNEVVVATAAHEKEAQRLQTYTDISSALSKISPSAASSVAPALADIMLKHEQCKHRVDEGFTALGGVWEQVFDVFVTEVVRVIDSRLQGAISTIEKEREHAVQELLAKQVIAVSSIDRKRARTRGSAENEELRAGREATRDHKRRRFSSRSFSPDSRDRHNRDGDGVDSSIEDILMKIKLKINQQANSLQTLEKEISSSRTH